MKRLLLLMWAVLATGAGKDAKVEVCHIPPGDPGNYHTLTIPTSALKAHLGHGDLAGSCGSYCGLFCNTGNKCAQDSGTFDATTGRCVCSSMPVDCSATSPCLTVAGCDPTQGCEYTVNVDAVCKPAENVCVGPSTCNASGDCQPGVTVPNCCLGDDVCQRNDPCVQDKCDLLTNQCEHTPMVCTPPNACEVSVCDSNTGSCQPTPIVCTSPGPCMCENQCVDTASDPQNCGACWQSCSNNNVGATCSGGICSGSCSPGFADCNLNKLADGCEVNLMTDSVNCGTCGTVCGEGTACVAGVCTGLCPGGRCSTSMTQACAYDKNCPSGETCQWTQSAARFVDNGDGTVTDRQTCLMWEKKEGSIEVSTSGAVTSNSWCPPVPGESSARCEYPHDVNNHYSWSTGAPWAFSGSAATDFLVKLNNPPGFAGYTDWRLPTSSGFGTLLDCPTGSDPELESILSDVPYSCWGTWSCYIEPIFGPTGGGYWTSSPCNNPYYTGGAWYVSFGAGTPKGVYMSGEAAKVHVRAVRGGAGSP